LYTDVDDRSEMADAVSGDPEWPMQAQLQVHKTDTGAALVLHQQEGDKQFDLDTASVLGLMLALAETLPEDIFPGEAEVEEVSA
jgi:hypothetical protein